MNPEDQMDAVVALFLFSMTSTALAVLGLASGTWGSDSRPRIGDDHAR